MAKPATQPAAPAAATTPARRARKPAKPRRRVGIMAPLVFTAIIVMLALTAMPICILLVAGMLPSITAYLIDKTPRRGLSLTVAPLNFSGVVPFLMQLWFSPNPMALMDQLITKPWVWMAMYMAAGAGWLLHFGMPLIVALFLEQSLENRKSKYVVIQKELKAEWGEDVDPKSAKGSKEKR